jgi:hypothetical protein
MNRNQLIIAVSSLVVGAAAGIIGTTATEGSAAPAKPAVQTTIAPPVCEGSGSTSFCHITIKPDGTEWLFNEDGHGTIVATQQTPPK